MGYRGLKLSGGQIQRIGIARAIYFKPKFIILDESINALDKSTEEHILNDFRIKKRYWLYYYFSEKTQCRFVMKFLQLIKVK